MRPFIPLTIAAAFTFIHGAASAGDVIEPIAAAKIDRSQVVQFDEHIRPILAKKCFVCHSGNVTEGGLNLSSHAELVKGGERGSPIQSGKADESLLVKSAARIAEPYMPPPDEDDAPPLTPEELALVKLWIDQGAKPPSSTSATVIHRPLSPSVLVVRAVAIAPDKSFLAAGRANEIHLFAAQTGDYLRSLVDPDSTRDANTGAHTSMVESLAVSPTSDALASGAFGEVAIWSTRTGQQLHKLTGFSNRVTSLHYSPDGKFLACGGGAPTVSGEVKIFNATSGQLVIDIPAAHSDTVFGLRFSPDGQQLATCSADMSIKIFDTATGKLARNLEGHTHHVLDVAWQADGRLLASAGADKRIRLWDLLTGEQLTKINRGGGQINTIWLEHDAQVGRLLFVGDTPRILACNGRGGARQWRLSKEMRPGNYAKPYIRGSSGRSFGEGADYTYGVDASSDGKLVAIGGRSGVVRLYQGDDGELIGELTPPAPDARVTEVARDATNSDIPTIGSDPVVVGQHDGLVSAVAHSADGKLFASAGFDGTVRLFDAVSAKPVHEFTGHTGYVRNLAFSPDGELLASCGADQTIILWDCGTRQQRAVLRGHVGEVRSVCFLPDGTLGSAGHDATIRLWDISQRNSPDVVTTRDTALSGFAVSREGKLIATADAQYVITISEEGNKRATLTGHTDDITCVAFSPDAKQLVSSSRDGTIRVWDASGKELLVFKGREKADDAKDDGKGNVAKGHQGVVFSVAFSPDGKHIASAAADKLVKIWNSSSGEEMRTLQGHNAEVYRVRFSPGGQMLASASHDGEVKLWDVASGKARRSLKGHQGFVRGIAFSPDGKRIATASADRTAKVWNAESGKMEKTLEGHTGIVFGIAFSGDGKLLATTCGDESIKLWNADGELRATLYGHRGDIYHAVFASDGRHVLSAGEDGTVRRWAVDSGKPPHVLTGHRDLIYRAVPSPDGKILASCSADGAIKLWDLESNKQLATLEGHMHLIVDLAFSPDGEVLASASHDGTAILWDVKERKQLNVLNANHGILSSVTFSLDSKSLAIAGYGAVSLWDRETGELLGVMKRPGGICRSIEFSPSGNTLLGALGKTIVRWTNFDR